MPCGYASDVSGIAIVGYGLLAVATVLLLVGSIAAVRGRRHQVVEGSDLPAMGAVVTPPHRGLPEQPRSGPPQDEAAPEAGSVARPAPAGAVPPIYDDLDPDPLRPRRGGLLTGAAAFAAGAALAWVFSRLRSKRES